LFLFAQDNDILSVCWQVLALEVWMQATFLMYMIVCPLIFLGGFVDSIAGGGGLISLPAYYLAGLPPALAGGTNKLSAMAGTAVSTVKYASKEHVQWKMGLASLLGSLPGSLLGAYLLTVIPGIYVKIGVVLALPVVAFLVLKNRDLSVARSLLPEVWSLPVCFIMGLVIGAYDGLVGPGTGTFLLLAYVALLGMDAITASGTAKLVNLGSNIGAFISLAATDNILYALALPAAVFGILGNYLGSSLAIKKGAPVIRALLIVVLALLLVMLVIDIIPEIVTAGAQGNF
jgi:uncharacterized membrane protein YfcA